MWIDPVRRDPIAAASVKRKVSADRFGASPTMNSIGFGKRLAETSKVLGPPKIVVARRVFLIGKQDTCDQWSFSKFGTML